MKAVIEIPRGDDRRRHLSRDKTGFVDLGPLRDVIPVNEGIMPVHYGYIPGTLNVSDGDEVDVLVLSGAELRVGQEVEIKPIAIIMREDGDDKVVAVDGSKRNLEQWWEDVAISERELIEKFFSYHHKILSVKGAELAVHYIHKRRQYI